MTLIGITIHHSLLIMNPYFRKHLQNNRENKKKVASDLNYNKNYQNKLFIFRQYKLKLKLNHYLINELITNHVSNLSYFLIVRNKLELNQDL